MSDNPTSNGGGSGGSAPPNAWASRPAALPAPAPVDRGSSGANHGDGLLASPRRTGGAATFMPKWARNGGTFSPGPQARANAAGSDAAGASSFASSAAPAVGLNLSGGFSGLASPISTSFHGSSSGPSGMAFLRDGGSGAKISADSSAPAAPVPASRGGAKVESLGSSLAELRGLAPSSNTSDARRGGEESRGAPSSRDFGWGSQRRSGGSDLPPRRKGSWHHSEQPVLQWFGPCWYRVTSLMCSCVPCACFFARCVCFQLCATRAKICLRTRSQANSRPPCRWFKM